MLLYIASAVALWVVCGSLNMLWLKNYPNVMAEEWQPILLFLAPLSTFFIAVGLLYVGFSHLCQYVAGKRYNKI